MSDERKPCPKCGKVGLRDHDEWLCITCGTYGIKIYGWDSLGCNGRADHDETGRELGRMRFNRSSHVPIIPWTPAQVEEWHNWREGDPLPRWAESNPDPLADDDPEAMEKIERMYNDGWSMLNIAGELAVELKYVQVRVRNLRAKEQSR